MKKTIKSFSIVMIVLTLLLGVLPTNIQAATKNPLAKMPKTKKTIVNTQEYLKIVHTPYVNFYTPDYKNKIDLKATSSNKKVATVKVHKFHEDNMYSAGYSIKCKKPGKATIKVTAQVNGKTYKKSCTYVFEKYKNPFSSFKIGNKNYTSKLNKGENADIKTTYFKGKLSYKAKSGYKITKITAFRENGASYTVKNNSKLKSDTTGFVIKYQNKKSKIKGTIGINDDVMDFYYWYYE